MSVDSADKIKKICIVSAVFLAGCANQETLMRNAAGEERYCYLVHDSSIAKVTAVDQYTKCLNDAGAAGFRRIDR